MGYGNSYFIAAPCFKAICGYVGGCLLAGLYVLGGIGQGGGCIGGLVMILVCLVGWGMRGLFGDVMSCDYLYYMASNSITIDLKGWITQAEFARLHGYKLNTVSRWVKRAKEGEGSKKIQYLEVQQLGITLVKPI